MLDRFIDGTVSRLSPEAPVPILEKAHDSIMPGGAANVAINLAGLGCDVRLLSVTGGDTAGLQLAQILGSNLAIDFHQWHVSYGGASFGGVQYRVDDHRHGLWHG